jgi:hypothetical protein
MYCTRVATRGTFGGVIDNQEFDWLFARLQLEAKLMLKERRPIFVRAVRHEDAVFAVETGMIQNRRDIGGRHNRPCSWVEHPHVRAQSENEILEVSSQLDAPLVRRKRVSLIHTLKVRAEFRAALGQCEDIYGKRLRLTVDRQLEAIRQQRSEHRHHLFVRRRVLGPRIDVIAVVFHPSRAAG